jgi:uncharacterized protein (DUF697 family)
MSELDPSAQKVVEKHMWWAAGAGLIPVPYLDMAAIAGVELKMIKELAEVYKVPFKEERAKNIITSVTGGVGAGLLATNPTIGGIIRVIPLVGQTAATLSMPIFGGAMTYAIGKVFARHLQEGGTLFDFDPKMARDSIADQYQKGKDAILRKKAPQPSAA